jgi:hypothetical protein
MNKMFPLLGVIHKYSGWSYEREWRLIFFETALCPDRPQRMVKPSRVFLGARMEERARERLIEICTAKNIEVQQMRLDEYRFSLISD